jgi:hypothetical protein
MLTANGIADFTPKVKASYGLTFLNTVKAKININNKGIK